MKKTISAICAAAVTVATLGVTMMPADAAPMNQSRPPMHQDNNNNGNGQKQHSFQQHGDYAYFDGHKGYKKKHAGYKYYNGYWFPPAALVGVVIGGAIIGGIISSLHH